MNTVAKLAGVSQTTVSFVINNVESASIPQETRERVLAAVSELNYRPNMVARSLRTQRSGLIGLISDEIATTPYAGGVIEGTQDTAWDSNKILVLVNTKKNRDVEKIAITMLLERQVEGVIYAAMYHQPVSPPEILREVPSVLLNCYDEARSFHSVVPDEFSGGQTATEVLLAKGHRRIGFINFRDPIPATVGRLAGYRASLSAHGVPFDQNLIVLNNGRADGGYRGAQQLMQLAAPPTAIFCFNDRTAMGAYDALRKLNLRIPDDVAVMGFDNQELIAAHLYPPLTTVELPHYEMGAWAARHLLTLVEDTRADQPYQHKIEPRLIVRQSV